ncbi:hypothetical protein VM98_35090, partial [Streptomyces rubellomurinus subsp. indigoferus]
VEQAAEGAEGGLLGEFEVEGQLARPGRAGHARAQLRQVTQQVTAQVGPAAGPRPHHQPHRVGEVRCPPGTARRIARLPLCHFVHSEALRAAVITGLSIHSLPYDSVPARPHACALASA